MNKTIIHCKTTSPMFIAGSNTFSPELRAASIKGCMRFIWRAAQCAGDISKLREAEGQLFGNAFGGEDTRQSDMRIRVENERLLQGSEVMTPHRVLDDYESGKKAFSAKAFKSGGTFDVVISSFIEKERHVNFIRLFALTCLLYGFGRRSRKGFGTVEILGIDGDGNEVVRTFDGTADNLNQISKNFNTTYVQPSGTSISVTAKTPANYPYIESIKIMGTKEFDCTASIISQIGLVTHRHTGSIFLGSASKRLASSVLLSTVPWGNDKYRCIATQLHCSVRFPLEKRDGNNGFFNELNGRV